MLGVDYVEREFNNAQNSLTPFCHCDYWGRGVVRRPARIRKTVCNKWRGHQRNGSRGLFTMSKPVLGNADQAFKWNGVTWHFASGENRQMFERDPEKYAPQYGGHCVYAMSKGYIAPTVPEAWTIYEDRLYLNFSLRARELWLQDVPGNIALGDANWPKLKD